MFCNMFWNMFLDMFLDLFFMVFWTPFLGGPKGGYRGAIEADPEERLVRRIFRVFSEVHFLTIFSVFRPCTTHFAASWSQQNFWGFFGKHHRCDRFFLGIFSTFLWSEKVNFCTVCTLF